MTVWIYKSFGFKLDIQKGCYPPSGYFLRAVQNISREGQIMFRLPMGT